MEQIKQKLSSLSTILDTLPGGELICSKNGHYYKWYHSIHGKLKYIPKKNRLLAEQLAYKKYITYQLQDLQNEYDSMLSYMNNHHPLPGKASALLSESTEFRSLLLPHFSNTSLSDWLSSPYEKNPKYPEQLIHKSSSGNMVRSKSEAIIDTFLFLNKIPFRYECLLELGNVKLYPDFTIRHPKNGNLIYWEHFGRMDDPGYARKAASKLQLYISHGIIPSIHLITTYETKDVPLTTELAEKIIQYYFL